MHVKKLPIVVSSEGMPAVALTDTNNMFGALEFSELASSEGVQPIIGCQVDLAYMTADNDTPMYATDDLYKSGLHMGSIAAEYPPKLPP